jgi:hypothetical protein
MDLGFGIWDLGFGIWDLGFGIWDLDLDLPNNVIIVPIHSVSWFYLIQLLKY